MRVIFCCFLFYMLLTDFNVNGFNLGWIMFDIDWLFEEIRNFEFWKVLFEKLINSCKFYFW